VTPRRLIALAIRTGLILVGIVALCVLAGALFLFMLSPSPPHNQETLKAINAESQLLMATYPATSYPYSEVPERRWPRVIASLKPKWVTVNRDGVEIMIEPFFDGAWEYEVPRRAGEQPPPPLEDRCYEVGQGVYRCRPY
jgi:hypothetical protein